MKTLHILIGRYCRLQGAKSLKKNKTLPNGTWSDNCFYDSLDGHNSSLIVPRSATISINLHGIWIDTAMKLNWEGFVENMSEEKRDLTYIGLCQFFFPDAGRYSEISKYLRFFVSDCAFPHPYIPWTPKQLHLFRQFPSSKIFKQPLWKRSTSQWHEDFCFQMHTTNCFPFGNVINNWCYQISHIPIDRH